MWGWKYTAKARPILYWGTDSQRGWIQYLRIVLQTSRGETGQNTHRWLHEKATNIVHTSNLEPPSPGGSTWGQGGGSGGVCVR